jgi:hypothetical protein
MFFLFESSGPVAYDLASLRGTHRNILQLSNGIARSRRVSAFLLALHCFAIVEL